VFGHDPMTPEALRTKGIPRLARVTSARSAPRLDGRTGWHFVVTLGERDGVETSEFDAVLAAGREYPAGAMLPVLQDKHHRSVLIVDESRLPMYDEVSAKTAAQAAADRLRADLALGTKRWLVPDHCPNCGAVVDQATVSLAADPRCEFCHQPLPLGSAPPTT
jgi:hypothetical protein